MLIRTDDQNYIGIANSIRQLNGKSDLYTPAQMHIELEKLHPSRGIVYDTFDDSGNLLTASVYGDSVGGLGFNDQMTSVNFVDAPTEILDYAFNGCTSLVITELPDTIKTIGTSAFSGCENLTISQPPASCEDLGNDAFYGCVNLPASFKFNNGLKSIHAYVVAGCPNVTIADIPDSVEYLYTRAFSGNKTASHIKLPKSLKYLGPYVFQYCTTLAAVTFQCIPMELFSRDAFRAENSNWTSPVRNIYVPWAKDEVPNAPWGAKNATVHYNTAV